MSNKSFIRALVVLAVSPFFLRLGIRFVLGADRYWIDGYGIFASLAESLAAGDGYAFPNSGPTAFRVPFYPIFIALVTWGSREAWLLIVAQAVVSVATLVFGALIARRFFGYGPALITAILCAFYPYYAWHDLSLQETSLFTFLAVLATYILLRERHERRWHLALLTGLILGLAILTRATLIPLAAFAILWLVLPDQKNAFRKRFYSSLITLGALCLCLSPWLIRAKEVTGAYGFGTEFGAALYAGNHKLTFSHYPEESIDKSTRLIFSSHSEEERAQLAQIGDDEIELRTWYRSRGIDMILADPPAFFTGTLRKLGATFGPLPSPRQRLPVTLIYVASWSPIFLLGLVGLWRSRRNWRRDAIFYAHIASFAAITAVLWGHTSHRSYLDIYFMIFAANTIAALLDRYSLGPRWIKPSPHKQGG